MALTQYQELKDVQLIKGFNNNITASSDQVVSHDDFTYEVQMFTSNSFWNGITPLVIVKQLPRPDGFLVFNPSPFYDISSNIDVSSFLYHNENSYIRGALVSTETYQGGSKSKPNPFYLLLNGEENSNIGQFVYGDYTLDGDTKKLLTDYSDDRYFTLTSYQGLSMLNGRNYPAYLTLDAIDLDVNNDYFFFEVILKSSENLGGGSLVDGIRFRILNDYIADIDKSRIDIILTADYINDAIKISTQTLSGGVWSTAPYLISTDVITDNTKYYDFWTSLDTESIVQTSIKYRYKLLDCNDLYEDYNIMWNNRLSGIESFVFKKLSEDLKVSQDEYISKYNTINETTGILNKTFYDRETKIYNSNQSSSFKLSTGLISTETGELFRSLLTSDNIILFKDGNEIPLTILTDTIDIKNSDTSSLTNYIFNFRININTKLNKI